MPAAQRKQLRYDGANLDADQAVFFNRELEFIDKRMFSVDYALCRARELIPVDHSAPPGTTRYTWRQWDRAGLATIGSDSADDDQDASVGGTEASTEIYPLQESYGYSFREIRAAALVGRPLDQMRAMACRDGFEQKVDDLASYGDSARSILGLVNQTAVPLYTIPVGASGKTTWADKTPDEIIADVTGMISNQSKLTKQREKGTRLLLPTTAYEVIAGTPRSSQSDTTILQFLLNTSKSIKEIDTWVRLDGSGGGAAGTAATDRAILYTPDPMKLQLLIPMEQTPLPPQQIGTRVRVHTEGECGGTIFFKPYSAEYADGI